jgi:menaquinone-dependent protoporphyrinogen oxidase
MAATGAKGHRLFAGKVDRHRLGFGERALLRAVGAKDGDYREWDAIAGWALAIASALEQ